MPELPINSSLLFLPFWGLHRLITFSVMCFPSDKEKREQFISVMGIDTALKNGVNPKLNSDQIEKLVHSTSIDDCKRKISEDIFIRAYQAGLIVLYLYVLERKDKTPSLNRAIRLVETKYSKNAARQKGLKPIPHSETNIRKNWKEFKSVSHFWAAHIILNEDNPINTELDFYQFLLTSEHFLSFCLDIVSEKVKTPLFDKNEMWSVPKAYSMPNIELIELEIDKKLIDEIETYSVSGI